MRKPLAMVFALALVVAGLVWGGGPKAAAADRTAELQGMFDGLQPGDTLTLEPGAYPHSGILNIGQHGVTINGNGATLEATNPATAALIIRGDGVSLNNLNLTAPVGLPRQDHTDRTLLVSGRDGFTISDVTITGGSSAGMYLPGASNFVLERVTIRDTAADGIQITAGSHNGQLNNVTTSGTGDDGIAIVSHTAGPAAGMCHDIVVNSPVVESNRQARGLVVAGGDRVSFNNINVSNTSGSGVFVGSQATFYTGSSTGVTVNGGTVTGANYTAIPMGAVTVLSANPGQTVADVTISDLSVVNTPPAAGQNIGIGTQGGTLSNIAFRNIAIQQGGDLPVLQSLNAPRETYTTTGITLNGEPYTVP